MLGSLSRPLARQMPVAGPVQWREDPERPDVLKAAGGG